MLGTQPCLFEIPWTVAHQVPLSMGFSRQEYRTGLPFPSPGDLPNPGIKPRSPTLRADFLPSEPPGKLIKKDRIHIHILMSAKSLRSCPIPSGGLPTPGAHPRCPPDSFVHGILQARIWPCPPPGNLPHPEIEPICNLVLYL